MDYDDSRRMYSINLCDASHPGTSHMNSVSHVTQSVHMQTNHHATIQSEHPRVVVGSIFDGSVVSLPQISGGGHQFQQVQHTLLHAPLQQAHQSHQHHIQQLECQTTAIPAQPIQQLHTAIHQHQLLNSNGTNIMGVQNIDIQHNDNNLITGSTTAMNLPNETVIVDVISLPLMQNTDLSKCFLCNKPLETSKNPEMANPKDVIMTSTRRSLREVLALIVGEIIVESLGNDLCNLCFNDLEKIDALQHNLLNCKINVANMCRNTLHELKPDEKIILHTPQLERIPVPSVVLEEQNHEAELPSDTEMKDDPNDPDVTLASLKQTRRKKICTKKKSITGNKKARTRTKKRPGRPTKMVKDSEEILEGEEAVSCPCCQKTIPASRYLKHIVSAHKVFPCPFCANIFRQRDIKHHVAEEHQDEIKFPCNTCSLDFATFSSLKRHCIEVHCGKKKERSKCDLCNKTFSSSGALKVHLETIHDNSQAVKCPVCKESFNQRGNMMNHFRRVHERNRVKKLQCSVCGKAFVCPSELRKHVEKVHLRLKKSEAVCSICSKPFAEERSLKVHINAVHTKEVKYPCTECKMEFNSLTNMLTHRRRMHAGIAGRKNVCGVCSKGFCSPSDLRTHVKVVHENVRKYVCDLCGQRFKVGSHLKYHRRRHTGEAPYKCPHCTKCFHGPSHISDHVKKVHRTVYIGINQRRKLNLPDDAPPPPPGILSSKDSKGTIILTTQSRDPQVTQILIPQQTQHVNTNSMQHILPFGVTNMISGPTILDPQNHYSALDQSSHSSPLPMVVRLIHDSSY